MGTVEIGITAISERLLSVSIDYHAGATPLIRKWDVDRGVVDGLAREIAGIVEDALAEPPSGSETDERAAEITDRLRSCGLALFQEILKDEGDNVRALGGRDARAPDIIFKLDKSLAYLPLEVMHDGEAFLSHRFAMGRVIYAEVADFREPEAGAFPRLAVLIGDPSSDPAISEDVEREIDAVRDIFRTRSDWRLKIALGADASLSHILESLPGAAVFHFSGHGTVSDDERRTGLKLGPSEVLSGYSLQGLHHAPVCAFLNVCTASPHEAWKGSLGIIEILLRRGTFACVASLWDVGSKTAIDVASRFYEHLLGGESFGEALRSARQDVARRTGIHDPTWAAYALYGDPRLGLAGKPAETDASAAGARAARRANLVRKAAVLAAMGAALALVGVFIVRPAIHLKPAATDATAQDTLIIFEKPEPPPKPQVGYVVIQSDPRGANILIDGKRIGVTPYAAELPIGVYKVVVEKSGYRRWEVSAEIRTSPRTVLDATLEKIK